MTRRTVPDSVVRLATVVLFIAVSGQAIRNLLGWWGYGAIVLVAAAFSVRAIILHAPRVHATRWPKSLLAFLLFATVSIAWSAYPGASAIGVTAQLVTSVAGVLVALCLTWARIATAFGRALRWTVGLSLLFELVVAVFVRAPILPLWLEVPSGNIPDAFYWTQSLLFSGGPIQGIVGNRNLLGFAALLGLIVLAVETAARLVTRRTSIVWFALFAITLLLTRSSTVALAAGVVVVVAAFAVWARSRPEDRRRPVYVVATIVAVVVPASLLVLRAPLLALAGKSADMTGRLDIWTSVSALAAERPVAGWGWVSYWVPWVAPFDHLAERKGVLYLQAHNAWLDVWFQLGIIGLVLFSAAVLTLLWRSWFFAVDRPRRSAADVLPRTATSLLPLLLLAALLGQSLAESRMLTEFGWILVVAFAIKTKLRTVVVGDEPRAADEQEETDDVRRARAAAARSAPVQAYTPVQAPAPATADPTAAARTSPSSRA